MGEHGMNSIADLHEQATFKAFLEMSAVDFFEGPHAERLKILHEFALTGKIPADAAQRVRLAGQRSRRRLRATRRELERQLKRL